MPPKKPDRHAAEGFPGSGQSSRGRGGLALAVACVPDLADQPSRNLPPDGPLSRGKGSRRTFYRPPRSVARLSVVLKGRRNLRAVGSAVPSSPNSTSRAWARRHPCPTKTSNRRPSLLPPRPPRPKRFRVRSPNQRRLRTTQRPQPPKPRLPAKTRGRPKVPSSGRSPLGRSETRRIDVSRLPNPSLSAKLDAPAVARKVVREVRA